MEYNYDQEGGKRVYVDNATNRRLGRVGKTYGKSSSSKPVKDCPKGKVRSPKGRCVKDKKSTHSTSVHNKPKPKPVPKSSKTIKAFKLLFSTDILVFDKRDDLGFKISSLDNKNKPNKELKKYIDFDKLISWHKKQLMDFGGYVSTDAMKVTINDVKKESNGIMSVKMTLVYDTPRRVPYEVEPLPDEEIEFIGQMIATVDDDGNYPVKVKKSAKYKTTALVGSKLLSFKLDDKQPSIKTKLIREKKPSHLVDSKNDKLIKISNTKEHGKVRRLSAGAYYRKHRGRERILGDICQIRDTDPELKCLLKRTNGTVYWAKKSKSGKGQEACGNWKENCKE